MKLPGTSTPVVSEVESNGEHIIAEYARLGMACANGNNNLLRKNIYGPGIDQPVSMIEVDDNGQATAYYYHFDAPFDCAQGRLGLRGGPERLDRRYSLRDD